MIMKKKFILQIVLCATTVSVVAGAILFLLLSNRSEQSAKKQPQNIRPKTKHEFLALSYAEKRELYEKQLEERDGTNRSTAMMKKNANAKAASDKLMRDQWLENNPESAEYLRRVTSRLQAEMTAAQNYDLTNAEKASLPRTGRVIGETAVYQKAFLKGVILMGEDGQTAAYLLEYLSAPEQEVIKKCTDTPFGNLARARTSTLIAINSYLITNGLNPDLMSINEKIKVAEGFLRKNDLSTESEKTPENIRKKIEIGAQSMGRIHVLSTLIYLHAPSDGK